MVEDRPNWLQRLFGRKSYTRTFISAEGISWYEKVQGADFVCEVGIKTEFWLEDLWDRKRISSRLGI
jgi:hypothetical protein